MFEIRNFHNCSVNANANIFALFLTVCAHGCKTLVLSDKMSYQIRKGICVLQEQYQGQLCEHMYFTLTVNVQSVQYQ